MSKIEKLGDGRILFMDISSTCTGWAIASQDSVTLKVTIHRAGAIWFPRDWPHGKKYHYLREFVLNVAYVGYQVEHLVVEGYMVNKNRIMGTLVIPEATGAVKAACFEQEPELTFHHVYPQTWRSVLGIKKDINFVGSKAWKEPAKKVVWETFPDQIPVKMLSNVTGKLRPVPHDLFDVLCICMAWYSKEPNANTGFILEEGAITND